MNGGIKTAWLGRRLEYFDELASTNTYLKENAGRLPHGAAVIAGKQTGGKGRLGRVWQDDGTGLALSVLLHGQKPENMTLLPLIAGVAVLSAVEKLTGLPISLKWSNDVLIEARKLCGILCESRISRDGAFAVVGMGVNLNQDREYFERLGLVYATSLKIATGKNFDAFETAAAILNELEPLLETFEKFGFSAIGQTYKSRCITLGKDVRVIINGVERTGKAVDIADDGGLICETGGKTEIIRAGEASVRGLYGYT